MKRHILLYLLTFAYMGANAQVNYPDIERGEFKQRTVSGVRSMSDGEHYTTLSAGRIVKYGYSDGKARGVLFDAAEVSPRIKVDDYSISGDGSRILLATNSSPIYRHSSTAEYMVYDTAAGTLTPLSVGGRQRAATLSPDGKKAAFVRDNDLYWVDLATMTEHRITNDGRPREIINGVPDWVYEEEFSFDRAYEWGPDSRSIAFMRFDESKVREFTFMKFDGKLYPSPYTYKYPKAGERNSEVSVHIHDLAGGSTVKCDVGEEQDQYIPRIMWSPASRLYIYRLNRAQNRFELLDGQSGKAVYTEENKRYVERVDSKTITFLPDGDRFVVRNETDGWMHLYLYSVKKGLLNRITSGNWEVTELCGVEGDKVYFLSTEGSPLRRSLWSARLDGSRKRRLTPFEGMTSVRPSAGFRYFICYHSSASTPLTVTLHREDGRQLRVLEDNRELRTRVSARWMPKKEFFTLTNSVGDTLNGYIMKPQGFDPQKKYPLFMTQYSGPGSQQVADQWSVGIGEAVCSAGYVVVCVDGRGTGFRGEEFKKCTYRNLGALEVQDQIDVARHFAGQPFIDPARIGIYGWSYGGFMALNCILKGNDVFKLAVAVAPVTNWRFYDTIYTELYNGKPQDNPKGYDDNSPLFFADRLKGKLLIIHGTADDNVHVQNTYEMISELTRHGKRFETMIYPDKNHGMMPGPSRHHVMYKIIGFVTGNL